VAVVWNVAWLVLGGGTKRGMNGGATFFLLMRSRVVSENVCVVESAMAI